MLWTYPLAERQGGFIDTTTGSFTPDPASVLVFDTARGLFRTPDKPYLYGSWGDSNTVPASYDAAQHRWLPVPQPYVSPDGKTYAYAVARNSPQGGGGVHLVDVATGVDRVIPGTTSLPYANYFVAGYLKDGIYVDQFGPTGGGGLGLWRLDPATAAITQVSTDAPALGVVVGETPIDTPPSTGNPDAWWTTDSGNFADAEDPNLYFQYLSEVAGQHAEEWFSLPGFHLDVLGADKSGNALVLAVSPDQVGVWLLSTPNSATELHAAAATGSPDRVFKTAVADKAGWWIGSKSGVFFATASTWAQVSSTPAVVVGGCS